MIEMQTVRVGEEVKVKRGIPYNAWLVSSAQ